MRTNRNISVLFLGMQGEFPATVLNGLLDACIDIKGIVTPVKSPGNRNNPIPVINNQDNNIESIALDNDLPIVQLHRFDAPGIRKTVSKMSPDIIIVACFPLRIPDAFLSLAKYGGFNLHPSLLPRYRGPVPLFWQFRDGTEKFGVTLHRISSQFDKGDIAMQKTVQMPDGISGKDANHLIAQEGSHLIRELLSRVASDDIEITPQNEDTSSYQGWPDASSFEISPLWSARRAFNFIKATRHWGQAYPVRYRDKVFNVYDASGYSDRLIECDYLQLDNGKLLLRFCDGTLVTSS